MDDRMKWNVKYLERLGQSKEPEPNPRLKVLSPYLVGGMALDLACGLGANSMFLARMNYRVQSIDVSDVAISYLRKQAEKNNLEINPQVSDLTDIHNFPFQENLYELVVITYYLDRSLFTIVKRLIKEQGYFFMETFYQSPQHKGNVSSQFKLNSNELLSVFRDWKVLFFEENEQEGRQTLFCQKGKVL